MKTLILYASKYGATKVIAQQIANKIPHADIRDIKSFDGQLNEYDAVLIGSPVYAGMLRKEAKQFVTKHADALCQKPLGLFLCGLSEEGAEKYLDTNYPKQVVAHAKAKALLGGIYDPDKVGFLERTLMRVVIKRAEYVQSFRDEAVQKFVEAMETP